MQNNEKNLKEINDWAKTHSKLIGRNLKTHKYISKFNHGGNPAVD